MLAWTIYLASPLQTYKLVLTGISGQAWEARIIKDSSI